MLRGPHHVGGGDSRFEGVRHEARAQTVPAHSRGIAPDGFGIDWNKVIFKMLTLKGIYGREMFETWYKMIAFVQGGLDVGQIITHRIKIDEFRDGFEAMRSGNSGKVVMDWG